MRKTRVPKAVRTDIQDAFDTQSRLVMLYASKKKGIVTRTVRPYEMKGGKLYATDTLHGATKIHSFLVDRILDSYVDASTFKPNWPIKGETAS